MIEKTILIADDDNDLCQALALRCRGIGMKAVVANDGIHALKLAETIEPDLICLDVDMPGGNGLAVCEMLGGIPSIESASIAILTGRKDIETIERCRHLGATYIHKSGSAWNELENLIYKPIVQNSESTWMRLEPSERVSSSSSSTSAGGNSSVNFKSPESSQTPSGCVTILDKIFTMLGVDQHFLESNSVSLNRLQNHRDLTNALRMPESSKQPWVLHVDDDSELSDALKIRFEVHGVSVVQACTGRGGSELAFTNPVSAIILDLDMPGGDGRYVLESLKACEATKHIPVVILTGHRASDRKQEMFSLGANCFLEKPIPFETLYSKLLPHLGLPK